MDTTNKLSSEQIHEIAEQVDIGKICYINANTGEVIFMLNDETQLGYGISWENDEMPSCEIPDWQKEMHANVKTEMAKINSWDLKDTIQVKKPSSHEAFKFMERFVDEIIPEGRLKRDFWNALSKRHPFRNFNAIVHDCEYRENWFEFKQNALEEYVRKEIAYKYSEEE